MKTRPRGGFFYAFAVRLPHLFLRRLCCLHLCLTQPTDTDAVYTNLTHPVARLRRMNHRFQAKINWLKEKTCEAGFV
ncbi:hypothetical protein DSJ_05140 [Pantoea stewartii subsp. stewartii DC283]|uniref:Secreted protein n=1 Tax=Pantoea stewartii subsp. stewartii DC283 TaxID=660596 RepID=A0ABM6K3Y3_PANSE|nr:hypothetical protein DSJ_05140 [Pantoea stewartii subsp. stewartii DC283]